MKTFGTAVVTSGLIIGSTAAVMAPATASARTTYQCEVTKENSAKTGAVLGVVAGGLLGSQVAKNEKGIGAVAGAVLGGFLGNKLGRDQGKDTCNKAEAAMERQRWEDRHYGYRSEPVRYNSYKHYRNDDRYGSRY
ncbi:glycine zipper domain-containing protein [Asticcacaulis sp.]|uniref:glycine zipper domain-containing protein n=1 Tax=Asticcacaulis sp. TaxID=1872648 RepID=UPI003F7B7BDE